MRYWHWVEHVEHALLPNIIIRKPNSTTIGGVPDRHNVLVSYSGSGRALRAASTPWSGCRRSAPRPLRSARARNHQRSVAGQCRPAELILAAHSGYVTAGPIHQPVEGADY